MDLNAIIQNKSLFYITPDVKRGIGFDGIISNFHIICTYFDPLITVLRRQGVKIFCLREADPLQVDYCSSSGRLLENIHVVKYIRENSENAPLILAFKPSEKIDFVCKKFGYRLLINNKNMNDIFENKVSFYKILQKYLPQSNIPGFVDILGTVNFKDTSSKLGAPFVIQFAHGWAGKTTYIINTEKNFLELQKKFSLTEVKITKYIESITVLNNACLYKGMTLVSLPAVQLSNIPLLHKNPSVTCGRQWPATMLTSLQKSEINNLTLKVGSIMDKFGFKGYFGMDFLIDKKNGKIFISENNARFTASSSFYSKLEMPFKQESTPLIFFHLAAYLNKNINTKYTVENILGSQVILRNPKIIPNFGKNINYGVFDDNKGDFKLQSLDYKPGNLKSGQFIFIRRVDKSVKADLEIGRIETKNEVIDINNKLLPWFERLIQKSGRSD